MIIYADVLILENFIVNLFLLTVTTRITKQKYTMKRMIISSSIGSIYTLVLLIPSGQVLTSIYVRLLVLLVMIRIVYGKINFISIIKVTGIFLMITFTLSGLCFALSFNQNNYRIGGIFKITNYSIKYLLLGIMIIYILYERLNRYLKDKTFVSNYSYKIEFEVCDRKYSIKSFLDTGNELREPITNLPCILIEDEMISDIKFDDKNTYYIPYSSVGYSGRLKGIRINRIRIKNKSCNKEIDAIICPCKEKLSKENEFNGLLPRGIL